MPAAASAVRSLEGPVLLTTGRGGLAVFADLPHRVVIRTVDPPDPPLPADHTVLLARGPYRVESERALMRDHGIRTLVTKDSGGEMTAGKLVAARELGVAVVMVDRPPVDPAVPSVTEPADVLAWLRDLPVR
jgi:precorrin-6A/cobalt-precorrin-6A reductase